MSAFEDLKIYISSDMLDGIRDSDDATASDAYIKMRKHITNEIRRYAVDNNSGEFNIANYWFDTIINACDDGETRGGQTRRKKNKVLNKTRKK